MADTSSFTTTQGIMQQQSGTCNSFQAPHPTRPQHHYHQVHLTLALINRCQRTCAACCMWGCADADHLHICTNIYGWPEEAIFVLTPPHWAPFFIYADKTSILCWGDTVATNSSVHVMDAPLVRNKLSRGSNKWGKREEAQLQCAVCRGTNT